VINIIRITGFVILFFLNFSILNSTELAHLSADYLLYSFDHNYIYAKGNVIYETGKYVIRGENISISIGKNTGRIMNNVTVSKGKTVSISSDITEFKLTPFSYTVLNFGNKIGLAENKKKIPSHIKVSFSKLKNSLLYFVGKEISIKNNLDIYGHNITAFVEGLQSFSFKSIRMNRGGHARDKIIELNKIWYYNNYGLLADFSLNLKNKNKEKEIHSFNNFRLNYDIFDKYSNGSDLGLSIVSQNKYVPGKKTGFILNMNYIKDNMSQVVFGYDLKKSEKFKGRISLDLKKNIGFKNENWIRSSATFTPGKKSIFHINYDYEKSREYSGGFRYLGQLGKRIQINLKSLFSGIRNSDSSFNKKTESDLSLRYSTKIFNLSTEYSFNRESFYKKRLSSPKFDLSFLPLQIYGGLLDIEFSTSMIFTEIALLGNSKKEFRSNSYLGLSSKKIVITPSTDVRFSIRSELFFDRDQEENYISEGFILKGTKKLIKNLNLEFLYNYYTRRKSMNWMIEGSTASDFSVFIRRSAKNRKGDFWASISYDMDSGNFKNSYLNIKFLLFKGWEFQAISDYDFTFKNFNYNLYLDRRAGRFRIRFSFRSITRQFQLEIIPN